MERINADIVCLQEVNARCCTLAPPPAFKRVTAIPADQVARTAVR
jgi:hypothetical protein